MDTGYDPEEAERLLMGEAAVRDATIPEIRRMLTLVERDERFCDGWWSSIIKDGRLDLHGASLAKQDARKCASDAERPSA